MLQEQLSPGGFVFVIVVVAVVVVVVVVAIVIRDRTPRLTGQSAGVAGAPLIGFFGALAHIVIVIVVGGRGFRQGAGVDHGVSGGAGRGPFGVGIGVGVGFGGLAARSGEVAVRNPQGGVPGARLLFGCREDGFAGAADVAAIGIIGIGNARATRAFDTAATAASAECCPARRRRRDPRGRTTALTGAKDDGNIPGRAGRPRLQPGRVTAASAAAAAAAPADKLSANNGADGND